MITSTTNSKIKNLKKLIKSSREREKQHCFIVEGPRMFSELVPDQILSCFATEHFEEKYGDLLKGISYEVISDSVCESLSGTRTPQGVIALVKRLEWSLPDIIRQADNPCLFLLENLQDPGNLGTIIRTAEAAGIDAVITDKESVDPYNMKVVRSTMGAIFRLPVITVSNLEDCIRYLQEEKIHIYAAHLEGEPFYEGDYTKPSAFLIGNEGQGLTEKTAALAQSRIRIPMEGRVESLNAAVAGTVIMFEALRQRKWVR